MVFNITQNVKECKSFLLSSDPHEIVLNILRIGVFTLYFVWLLIALKVKELQNKQMAFLINLNAVGIIYCLSGIIYFFHDNCSIPSVRTCTYLNIFGLFILYYSGYSMSALAIHRMACCYLIHIKTQLKCSTIIIVLVITWLFPLILSCIHLFGFKSIIYYNSYLFICLYDPFGQISSFIFFTIFSVIIPNVLIIASYLLLIIKLKRLQLKLSGTRNSKTSIESPSITIQLIIYTLSFEFSCIANLILIYQTTMEVDIFSYKTLKWFRLFKWTQHICPLGLLFLHPELLNKYKKGFSCK